jgi:hypothetical protein
MCVSLRLSFRSHAIANLLSFRLEFSDQSKPLLLTVSLVQVTPHGIEVTGGSQGKAQRIIETPSRPYERMGWMVSLSCESLDDSFLCFASLLTPSDIPPFHLLGDKIEFWVRPLVAAQNCAKLAFLCKTIAGSCVTSSFLLYSFVDFNSMRRWFCILFNIFISFFVFSSSICRLVLSLLLLF